MTRARCASPQHRARLASSVANVTSAYKLARENWIDVLGLGLPKENFNFAGIDGGPMLMASKSRYSLFRAGWRHLPRPAIADDPSQAIRL